MLKGVLIGKSGGLLDAKTRCKGVTGAQGEEALRQCEGEGAGVVGEGARGIVGGDGEWVYVEEEVMEVVEEEGAEVMRSFECPAKVRCQLWQRRCAA